MLRFTDDTLTNKMSILAARAIRAIDDTGADMTLRGGPDMIGAGTSGGFTLSAVRGWHELRPVNTRYASLQLASSARRAKAIEEIEGQLQLYAPTFQNGGVVAIEDFRRDPGKPLHHERLAKLGVRLTCLTKETYEAGKTASRAASKPRFITPTDQQVESLFPGILGEANGHARRYVVLEVDDPQKQVTSFAFGDPGGRLFPVAQSRSVKSMFGFYFHTHVPEDLVLYVYLAVPAALETVPFKVRNVVLP
jgi:hypothetical protein